ncbi:MAG: hypothetical protein HND57_02525 [Planctomycetes bacterium]|nr:hypothetical protein [Planctomycetota bacterium]
MADEDRKRTPSPTPIQMQRLLQEAIDRWPEFESDEQVNGADLVDWFSQWRARVKEMLASK